MFISKGRALALVSASFALAPFGHAAVVYDNLGTSPTAGYSELNANNAVFGDSLDLASAGQLTMFGCSLFNSGSQGNTGSIIKGDMVVRFYDNTTPYTGGAITGTLLGAATLKWDFGSSPLPAGYFATSVFDLSSLNIVLASKILVTQQFSQTEGNSLRNGMVMFGEPTVGSSPNTVYIKSSVTAEGLYTFSGNPGQVGYTVEVVPEPASLATLGAGLLSLLSRRRARR